jgi:hypothetical protein
MEIQDVGPKPIMKYLSREAYGDDDVPSKGKPSAFPKLVQKGPKSKGKCLNCKKVFEFYPSSWGNRLYCCDACGVAFRKKKAKRPQRPEEAEKARLRKQRREEELAVKARIAQWDLLRAEEIRQQQRAREAQIAGQPVVQSANDARASNPSSMTDAQRSLS